MAIITLTTDFGSRDGYVGAVKGVISRLAPEARIIDIAHDIPRGDIAHAAWVLATSTLEFPAETIHVVVVDPGVGGARNAVIARVAKLPDGEKQLYVGPDNGVFSHLPVDRTWLINIKRVAPVISPTFHGRDVIAYAAAALANNDPDIYLYATQLAGRLPWVARREGTGRVVHIDHYGNLITDLPAAEVPSGAVLVDTRRVPIVKTYVSVATGALLAYIGSANTVEIAVRDGRADKLFRIERGDLIAAAPAESLPTGPYR